MSTRDWWYLRFFDPRSKFDPVMRGQMSHFPEIGDFSDLQVNISKTVNRIEMKPSPSCSTFNSEQNDILFWHLDQIFIMHSIPERNKYHPHRENRPRANLAKGPD